jgi:hypothetical protein
MDYPFLQASPQGTHLRYRLGMHPPETHRVVMSRDLGSVIDFYDASQ